MACFRLCTILSSVPSISCIQIGIHLHSSTVTVNILYYYYCSDGCAPITIEELVSSPRILTHQHHNKLPPQASFPLKTSSSAAKHHELKVPTVTCSNIQHMYDMYNIMPPIIMPIPF